jgi:hypothetical protein
MCDNGVMTHTKGGDQAMYAIQVTGRHTGLVFVFGVHPTRALAMKELARREKHIGSANLRRTIITV